ncbi:hypothetical protein BDP27DRAFT_1222472, partial [Rhodocollybia butyracea]
INTYNLATSIPEYVWEALRRNPVQSNVILPLAEKAFLHEESTGDALDNRQLWITCVSTAESNPGSTHHAVELVLAFSKNALGDYPLFIVPTVSLSLLPRQLLTPRLHMLIPVILDHFSPSRVYSVFAPEPVAELFARIWSESTQISHYPDPYYAASLVFCTQRSFNNRPEPTMQDGSRYQLRPAILSDLEAVAKLCLEFSQLSEPFLLCWNGAVKEAEALISNKQVWVHEYFLDDFNRSGLAEGSGSSSEITCIVAFTRNTRINSTITKVVTSDSHRGLGCAQRLVRQVCKHMLYEEGKQSIALYVAHDNISARKVYHNVGFVGLDEPEHSVEGVERWSEIGFDRTKVQLGHW